MRAGEGGEGGEGGGGGGGGGREKGPSVVKRERLWGRGDLGSEHGEGWKTVRVGTPCVCVCECVHTVCNWRWPGPCDGFGWVQVE
eukprot:2704012-Rhodomonas_salina.3